MLDTHVWNTHVWIWLMEGLESELSDATVRVIADLTPEVAVESTRLPGVPRGDPADRMIIATTRVLGGTLATCDERILAYGILSATSGAPLRRVGMR